MGAAGEGMAQPWDRGTCQTFRRHELPNLCRDRIFFQPAPNLLFLLRFELQNKFIDINRKFKGDDDQSLCSQQTLLSVGSI